MKIYVFFGMLAVCLLSAVSLSNMHIDHRVIYASYLKYQGSFAVRDHHHHSRVCRAIAL